MRRLVYLVAFHSFFSQHAQYAFEASCASVCNHRNHGSRGRRGIASGVPGPAMFVRLFAPQRQWVEKPRLLLLLLPYAQLPCWACGGPSEGAPPQIAGWGFSTTRAQVTPI